MSIRNLPSKIKVVMLKGEKGDKGDTGYGIPSGGTTGQALKKASNTDYDYHWQNTDLPAGGTTGQVLKKTSNADYEYNWVNEYYYDDTQLQTDVSALESDAVLKSNISATRLAVGESGTVNVSAGDYTNLDFDISGLVSSADNVIGLQRHRFAKSDYTEGDGLTITDATIETLSGNLYYRLRVYNSTDSAITLSKAQTYIYLVTFS